MELTFKDGSCFPDCDGPQAGILSKGQLHVHQRRPTKNQNDEVGDEESSCDNRTRKKQRLHSGDITGNIIETGATQTFDKS